MRRAFCRRGRRSSRFSPTLRRTSARRSSIDCWQRDEFVDYWAYKWSDVLLVSSRALGKNNVRDFYGWIRVRREGEHAVGQVRLRADHGGGPHRRERRRQLLSDSPEPDRSRRELHAGVSRPDADLRALPQPPDGEVDADRLLRLCQPLRARLGEGRRRRWPASPTRPRSSRRPTATCCTRAWACRWRRARSTASRWPAHAPVDRRAYLAQLDDEPAEHAVLPRRRESRLGELLRPRPRASGGRPALHEPGVERAAVRSRDRHSSSARASTSRR